MTYQPPPPPGMPPAGPGRNAGFDPKTINPLDWGIIAISFLLFIFSFFGYYTFSVGPFSESFSAWHFGGGAFIAWFAMLFGVAGGVPIALSLFAPQVSMPTAPRVGGLGLYGVSFVLYLIAIFAHSDFGPYGGHGFSFWLSLVLALAGTVLSLMRLQATGGQLPGGMSDRIPNIGGYGPQGGISGTSGTRPGPGSYPPPPPPTA